jgi:hypothetical protein
VASNNLANLQMFKQIHNFFNVGRVIEEPKTNMLRFRVINFKDCLIIQNHFINYPLMTYKLVHFKLWCEVIDLILAKEHLTLTGFNKLIALKAHSPKGLSEMLTLNFPNYNPINCPEYNPDLTKMNIHWIAGFMNADGSFGVSLYKSKTSKLGEYLKIWIAITQDNRSLIVLQAIKEYFGFGRLITAGQNRNTTDFRIQKLSEANDFIDQFKEAKLLGAKALDYIDFCKAIDLINTKAHLNSEGLEQIRTISEGINSTRTLFE